MMTWRLNLRPHFKTRPNVYVDASKYKIYANMPITDIWNSCVLKDIGETRDVFATEFKVLSIAILVRFVLFFNSINLLVNFATRALFPKLIILLAILKTRKSWWMLKASFDILTNIECTVISQMFSVENWDKK